MDDLSTNKIHNSGAFASFFYAYFDNSPNFHITSNVLRQHTQTKDIIFVYNFMKYFKPAFFSEGGLNKSSLQ